MQGIGAFLEGQPFIALFLVVGLGYALGRVQVAGFSLGIGAVLFVGLAIGAIAPKATPPGLLGSIGLLTGLGGLGFGRVQLGCEGLHFFLGHSGDFLCGGG